MTIYPYSDDKRYRVRARGDNVSSVVDRMVRVATKITECYASDIVLWCNKLNDAIKAHDTLTCNLNFREDGVDLYSQSRLENPDTLRAILSGGIQQWMLTVDWEDDVPITELMRVRISA